MSELSGHREVIRLSDEETESFEAQLKRGPGRAAKRTIARIAKARLAPAKEAVA